MPAEVIYSRISADSDIYDLILCDMSLKSNPLQRISHVLLKFESTSYGGKEVRVYGWW